MSLEDSINRLISVIEARFPVSESAAVDAKPAQRGRAAATAQTLRSVPTPKYDDVRVPILDLAEKKGMPAAIEVLKKFGVTNAKDLKPEQYSDVLTATREAFQRCPDLLPGIA